MRRGARLVGLLVPVAVVALAGGGWTPLGWVVALLVVAALALLDLAPSEVPHVVLAVEVGALALAGAALAAIAFVAGLPPWAQVALFLAPAGARHVVATRPRGARLRRDEEARLAAAPLAAVVSAVGASRTPRAVAEHLLGRPGGREALLTAARAGSPQEQRGAAEAAVALRDRERALSLEVARELLGAPTAARDAKARALVAIRDGADGPLLALLRDLARDPDPALRAAALEVRARSGDPRALDDWIADGGIDADATGPRLVLALGPRAAVEPRLRSLRDAAPEGSPTRARAQVLMDAFS